MEKDEAKESRTSAGWALDSSDRHLTAPTHPDVSQRTGADGADANCRIEIGCLRDY